MKNKLIIIVKLILLAFFSLMWFIFIQAEYEMITKPELQNDFPIIKGIYAVYFTGFILLVISAIIICAFVASDKTFCISCTGKLGDNFRRNIINVCIPFSSRHIPINFRPFVVC